MGNNQKSTKDEMTIEEIRQEINRLRNFAELSSDWFWEQDEQFRFVAFSGSNIGKLKRNQSDFIGRCRWEMPICEESLELMQSHKEICKRHESYHDFQYAICDSNGIKQRFSVSGTPVYSPSGEFTGYRGIGRNITELFNTKKALKEAQQQLTQIIIGSPIASFVIDINHKITHWNKALEALSGRAAKDAIGHKDVWRNFYDSPRPVMANLVLSGAIDDEIASHYGNKFHESKFVSGAYEGTDFFPSTSGGRWLYFTAIPLFDEYGSKIGAIETLQDITEQKRQEARILHQAHFDDLTDLPNRFLSLDRLKLMLAEANRSNKKVAVLFLDLDDFKKVNDSMGHAFGDELLVHSGKRLRSAVRNCDTVGRLGGDEFIILISNVMSEQDVQPIAEKLLAMFRKTFKVDNRDLLLTASVGIAIYPNDGDTPELLLKNADSAMYYSKKKGRNIYHFFSQEMNIGVSRRLALEEQLHGALSRRELSLNYQPVIDLTTGKVEGAEALIRWSNPILGMVPPDEFIPIAEQTGLIIPIGKFVLNEALSKLKHWRDIFERPLTIAVNLSPVQFRDTKLLQRMNRILEKNKLPSDCLNLEITEGVLLDSDHNIKSIFKSLSEMGINISMDDFGTGYSSLSYLRKFKFQILKIDRSFLEDFEKSKTSAALINATIAMAHALEIKVVAEGVETQTQLNYLMNQKCDFAQGYLYSKPVTAEKFEKYIEKINQISQGSNDYSI
ncbi:MAG: sensor domain-containing protein [Neptuniibacter sp.]